MSLEGSVAVLPKLGKFTFFNDRTKVDITAKTSPKGRKFENYWIEYLHRFVGFCKLAQA